MTFNQGRARVAAYALLVWVLLLGSASILLMAVAKGVYSSVVASNCSATQLICRLLQNLIALAVSNVFLLSWIWGWLPDTNFESWYWALVGPAGLCAAFFFGFAFFLNNSRNELWSALKEAKRRARVDSFNPQSNTQSVGSIQAGGHVNVEQTINSNPELMSWDRSFFRSPMGQITIAAAGEFLALVAGKLIVG